MEEAGVDLGEHVADRLGFVGELYGEGVLELGSEAGYYFDLEGCEIAESEEHADMLWVLAEILIQGDRLTLSLALTVPAPMLVAIMPDTGLAKPSPSVVQSSSGLFTALSAFSTMPLKALYSVVTN